MKTKTSIKICKEDILSGFIVPPENRGQIVTTSYACTEECILKKTFDASDHTEKIVAYSRPASSDEYEPQNRSPKLGRRLGAAVIVDEE